MQLLGNQPSLQTAEHDSPHVQHFIRLQFLRLVLVGHSNRHSGSLHEGCRVLQVVRAIERTVHSVATENLPLVKSPPARANA